jgi:DNA-binding CsgD family transcriptional regulator
VRARVPFDVVTMITSSANDPSWMDAHAVGVDDLQAMMEGHARVRHLDVIAQRMLANPLRVHRCDLDAPEIAGERMAPLRDHLAKFGGHSLLGVAVPTAEGERLTVLALGRASLDRRFRADEATWFEALAPHIVEASAINRDRWLRRAATAGDDALAAALLSADGRLAQTTCAFVQLLWPDAPPDTAYLAEPIRRAVKQNQRWPLPDGEHVLTGLPDESGGYFLRIRRVGATDRLSARERQIAGSFAQGHSYKAIAAEIGLSPATVRNHLQRIYEKLDVASRDELRALLEA